MTRRSEDASRKLWAIASDVFRARPEYAGIRMSKESWKKLLVAGVYGQKVVPALNGDGVHWLDARTSRMTNAQISEVIAFAEAWCAEQGIELSDELSESETS